MSDQVPFSLKNHGNKIIEIIVDDLVIGERHKALQAIALLDTKADHIIFTLSEESVIEASAQAEIYKAGELGKLKIIVPDVSQIKFPLNGIKSFPNIIEAKKRILGETTQDRALKMMSNVTPLRSSAYEILNLLRNPDVEFSEIEEVAAQDPTLVVRLLKSANSAFQMSRMPIETLDAAVTKLGIEGIRQLIIQEVFSGFSSFFVHQRDKLAHLKRVSHLSVFLGKTMGLSLPVIGKLRVCGLLHDVGALALCMLDRTQYAKVIQKTRSANITSVEAERLIFGIDHQEVGASFAREIGLPSYISECIAKHHEIDFLDDGDILTKIVACANGFLNEKIEQISFSEYDDLLSDLAEIKIENDNKKSSTRLDNKGKEEPEKSEEIEEFSAIQFYGLLKEELDRFIMENVNNS